MPFNFRQPATYLITSGATTRETTATSVDFARLLTLVGAAVAAGVTLVQLREKNLRARTLYELAARAAELTRPTGTTRLIVNDRADIARAAGADGVHLTTQSLAATEVRRTFGANFLIGVSTHTLAEVRAARDGGAADFAVFGPVFDTPAKRIYGTPAGLAALAGVARAVASFPVIALGGITRENAPDALRAGAHGVAAIRLFNDADTLDATVRLINETTKMS